MGEIPFSVLWNSFSFFVDELQAAVSSSEVLAHNLKNSQLSPGPLSLQAVLG
ncbi:hypothetical protein UDZ25_06980 [Serratia marcescens]|uniref:hypothetical protein n=1 Tax=Serratia TaxID=613 RepID=UPI0018D7EDF4|nr:hypothetical protein [Serratia ureilytica]MBH2797759.1 hypothetical protein [Serratia marcescens]MBH2903968.1 hypothetical protein [Serratia ureilytica]